MARFLLKLTLNAVALWLTTVLVAGVSLQPYANDTFSVVMSYLLIALLFGFVNGVVGTFVRIIAFPLYVLTLGLISLIVNGLLLMLVAWFTDVIGFGLVIEDFWWGVLGALVLGIISWLLNLVFRPARPSR
ncbi:phage holin family protein [Cryobacterium sp. TMT1-21]|uniref:Phage holin family protein n=1 Tax=Cryobacterium shii TaxID=1259235 RepID=A0AAQ2C3L0_9MICO|nr:MULTISPECIES: phage holin family protein [Cryobacterium]TFC41817.1 phage holin family protein [Cryobacterium shii]TFC88084.1 phage holin family protein [Cryobacterium sp. TmT2-59]TFD08614.1 phage holin family protein [Cryobacterium sp. TMT1-21]TFD14821.1 phage holin family protein [Cryobacterium sp. TMT4-10]TFD20031.1 phage holin family protein [Cryobacterium sp. TMT2-23]